MKGKGTIIRERPRAEAPAEAPTCRHHWLIESPRGAMSNGRCKICGEERQFRNSTADYIWEDDSSSGYGRWQGVRSVPRASDDDEVAASPSSGRGEPALVL